MTRSWKGWEYRVLSERLPAEKTAWLLDRPVAEVETKDRQVWQATMDDWYRHHRCPGSPRDPRGLVRLATKVMKRDFSRLVDKYGVLYFVWKVLRHTFAKFDPRRGDQSVPLLSSDIYFSLSATIRIPDHRPALGRANDNYFSRSGRPSGLSG